MQFSFEVGQGEPHRVEFYWGQMFGTLQIKVDNRIIEEKSMTLFSPTNLTAPLDVSEHEKLKLGGFEIQLVEKWTFEVGIYEKHRVRIERERPKLLAGLRPHIYRVFVDDELTEEHYGY
ncbi:MAG TPA: hypothetical protein VNB22_10315 [Pyrinomonadaceae bacterium]|nr:hypothetical protein [Pyrinomonadaceae bacterium]